MNAKIIVIDGKTYHSDDEMPSDVRRQYEQEMHPLKDADGNRVLDAFENRNLFADQDRDGIPDFVEGMFSSTNQSSNVRTSSAASTLPRSRPLSAAPTITPDTSNGWMLVLAGLFIVLLCVASAGAVWYFFLR